MKSNMNEVIGYFSSFGESVQVYCVGGCVRDTLLNREAKDIDYVVVGSTPDIMVAQGFTQVGASFPVFLKNGEEYALARTERKTGVGYNGFETVFDPTVTIVDDLERRDLTINSMAVRLEDWDRFVNDPHCRTTLLIDPFRGYRDLQDGILHHTSEAFAEDPVRVLRTARFAARYGFVVDLSTHYLMTTIVHELNHVPHERIWAEFEKGLMEDHPEKMIAVLQGVGAFSVETMRPYHQARSITMEKVKDYPFPRIRFAAISRGFEDDDYETCRIPVDFARYSKMVHKFGKQIVRFAELSVEERLEILMTMRVLTNKDFVVNVFYAAHILYNSSDMNGILTMLKDVEALETVDAAKIASECKNGQEIRQRIFDARIKVLS